MLRRLGNTSAVTCPYVYGQQVAQTLRDLRANSQACEGYIVRTPFHVPFHTREPHQNILRDALRS